MLALSISQLRVLFPHSQSLLWIGARRRVIGLAAFSYAVLHLAIFTMSIGRLDWIIQGMAFASMSTGWIAFALLAIVAAISNDRAHRRLGAWWKRLQRLVYPVAAMTLAHWLLLTRSPVEALAHALPYLALVIAARIVSGSRLRKAAKGL
ncbi:MAG: ferric reductase-like transmembrane domain-containing protein [Mesorhizobium sp.]